MHSSASKGTLSSFGVEEYVVIVGRANKRGELNNLVNTWTGPWWVVSPVGSQHMYGVEDIVSGQRKEVHAAWTSPPADESLAAMVELLLFVFTALNNPGGFQLGVIRAVAISADNDTEWVVQINLAGLGESEMT